MPENPFGNFEAVNNNMPPADDKRAWELLPVSAEARDLIAEAAEIAKRDPGELLKEHCKKFRLPPDAVEEIVERWVDSGQVPRFILESVNPKASRLFPTQ